MIRWITGNLGTAPWESTVNTPDIRLLDVRDLVDKDGNCLDLIQSKIETGVKALESGDKVVVCCDYGVSRSNAVAAGILAIHRNISFCESLELLIRETGERAIKIETMHAVADVVRHMQHSLRIESKPSFSSPRIVLTGGSGYLGSSLAPYLQDRFPTIALSSREANIVTGAVDLDLIVQQHSATHLVHLAVSRDFGKNSAVGESISMLKNALDVCTANRLKLIFVSSAEVFSGYTADRFEATELHTPLPRSSPGVAKYLCETLIHQHAAVHELEWTIFRLATIYGGNARRPKFLHTFIEKSLQGEDLTVHHYRNGSPEVDLLHIDDFCRAFVRALDKDISGVVHLGQGSGITTSSLFNLIQEINTSNCTISNHHIDANTPKIILNCSLAKTKLGWQPQISLREGIKSLLVSKQDTL